jgi:ABC-type Fe3+ transport system permease subunit
MSKAITKGAALLFFALIATGIWDLFRNSNALAAFVALIFVAAGIFNAWGALDEGNRRRELNQISKN